jgi:hypothetical protein
MQWLSKLTKSLLPSAQSDPGIVQQQVEGLNELVTAQRRSMPGQNSHAKSTAAIQMPSSQSHSNPIAQNILEKARAQQVAAKGDEAQVPTSASDLFFLKGKAQKRVQHLQNIYLEKARNTSTKFTQAAKNAFMPERNPFEKDK